MKFVLIFGTIDGVHQFGCDTGNEMLLILDQLLHVPANVLLDAKRWIDKSKIGDWFDFPGGWVFICNPNVTVAVDQTRH